MQWRRDFSRPVHWTKDGRLVYSAQPKQDPVIRALRESLRHLIDNEPLDAYTTHELYRVCVAMNKRRKELEPI